MVMDVPKDNNVKMEDNGISLNIFVNVQLVRSGMGQIV